MRKQQALIIHEKDVNLNEIYNKYIDCQKNHSAYLQTIEKALHHFGAFSDLDQFNQTQHFREILATIELDILETKNVLFPDFKIINY